MGVKELQSDVEALRKLYGIVQCGGDVASNHVVFGPQIIAAAEHGVCGTSGSESEQYCICRAVPPSTKAVAAGESRLLCNKLGNTRKLCWELSDSKQVQGSIKQQSRVSKAKDCPCECDERKVLKRNEKGMMMKLPKINETMGRGLQGSTAPSPSPSPSRGIVGSVVGSSKSVACADQNEISKGEGEAANDLSLKHVDNGVKHISGLRLCSKLGDEIRSKLERRFRSEQKGRGQSYKPVVRNNNRQTKRVTSNRNENPMLEADDKLGSSQTCSSSCYVHVHGLRVPIPIPIPIKLKQKDDDIIITHKKRPPPPMPMPVPVPMPVKLMLPSPAPAPALVNNIWTPKIGGKLRGSVQQQQQPLQLHLQTAAGSKSKAWDRLINIGDKPQQKEIRGRPPGIHLRNKNIILHPQQSAGSSSDGDGDGNGDGNGNGEATSFSSQEYSGRGSSDGEASSISSQDSCSGGEVSSSSSQEDSGSGSAAASISRRRFGERVNEKYSSRSSSSSTSRVDSSGSSADYGECAGSSRLYPRRPSPSPSTKVDNKAISRPEAAAVDKVGRLRRFKNKLGLIFHHHHNNNNTATTTTGDDNAIAIARATVQTKSMWAPLHKHKQKLLFHHRNTPLRHRDDHEENRFRKANVPVKHQGGHFHALVERLMQHLYLIRRHSNKSKGVVGMRKLDNYSDHGIIGNSIIDTNRRSRLKQFHWWHMMFQRQRRGLNLPNTRRPRVKLNIKMGFMNKKQLHHHHHHHQLRARVPKLR